MMWGMGMRNVMWGLGVKNAWSTFDASALTNKSSCTLTAVSSSSSRCPDAGGAGVQGSSDTAGAPKFNCNWECAIGNVHTGRDHSSVKPRCLAGLLPLLLSLLNKCTGLHATHVAEVQEAGCTACMHACHASSLPPPTCCLGPSVGPCGRGEGEPNPS